MSSDKKDSSDEFPPEGWKPSEEDVKRMHDEPAVDLDAQLGDAQDEAKGYEFLDCKYTREEVIEWSHQAKDVPSILAWQEILKDEPIKERSDFNRGFLLGFTHPVPIIGWLGMMFWALSSHQNKHEFLAAVCFALVVTSVIVRYKLKQEIKNVGQ